jgi:RND family efflux transporter MFP subunit
MKESQITVVTQKAKIADLAMSQTYSGMVRGENEVQVLPKVPARVTAIYVKPGDMVAQGQTLMTLDSQDFEAGVRQAQAGLEAAMAGKRANDLQVDAALKAYERTKKLHEAGAASDFELEMAKSKYDGFTAGSAEAGVASAQAGLQTAREALDKCIITSPISGMVGSVNVSLGDTANPQSPAAIVTTTQNLELSVMVPEADVSYIQEGTKVNVTVSAAAAKPYVAIVRTIARVADPLKRNYEVRISLANLDGKIKSGMYAEVQIDTMSKKDTLVVPIAAVLSRSGSNILFTVDSKKRAKSIDVKTGIKNDHYIEITSGIKEGQTVITKGNTLVSEGTLVRTVSGEAK